MHGEREREKERERERGGGGEDLVVSSRHCQNVSSDGPADVPHHVTESVQHLREGERKSGTHIYTTIYVTRDPFLAAETTPQSLSDTDNNHKLTCGVQLAPLLSSRVHTTTLQS